MFLRNGVRVPCRVPKSLSAPATKSKSHSLMNEMNCFKKMTTRQLFFFSSFFILSFQLGMGSPSKKDGDSTFQFDLQDTGRNSKIVAV